MQEVMKQAQRMQQTLLSAKKKIDETDFNGKSEMVSITINGKKQVKEIKINSTEDICVDDFDIFSDMIMIAFNNAVEEVDKEIENKLGSNAAGLGDLF